jgi:hypothetical protein
MNKKVVTLEKLKKIIEKDPSVKLKGGFFYNDNTVYRLKGDMNDARDYYFGLENRIVKIEDKEKIKELVWSKHARHDLNNGKLLYDGVVYDGGEFAKQEARKRTREEIKQLNIKHLEKVVETHNYVAKIKAKEILDNYQVKITKEAKEKAHRISERMVELTGPNEIHLEGVDFIEKEENPAIRDIYISDGQIATEGYCGKMSSSDMILTTRKLKDSGKKRFAWIHSHAKMPVFHSSTDDGNLKRRTELFGKEINLDISTFGGKSHFKLKIYPSLVFNALRDEPYVEVGLHYMSLRMPEKPRSSTYLKKKNALLKILNESNNIDLSTSTIDKEINERVTWYGKPISEKLRSEILERTGQDMSNPSYNLNSFKNLPSWRGRDKQEKEIKKQPTPKPQKQKERKQEKAEPLVEKKEENKKDKNLIDRVLNLEKGYDHLLGLYKNVSSKVDNYLQL